MARRLVLQPPALVLVEALQCVVWRNQSLTSNAPLALVQVAGIIIVPVALGFLAYALCQYRHRTGQIMSRKNVRYDDQRGASARLFLLKEQMWFFERDQRGKACTE